MRTCSTFAYVCDGVQAVLCVICAQCTAYTVGAHHRNNAKQRNQLRYVYSSLPHQVNGEVTSQEMLCGHGRVLFTVATCIRISLNGKHTIHTTIFTKPKHLFYSASCSHSCFITFQPTLSYYEEAEEAKEEGRLIVIDLFFMHNIASHYIWHLIRIVCFCFIFKIYILTPTLRYKIPHFILPR